MAIGKRGKKARQGIDRNAFYNVEKAVEMIKTGATAKFDETIEVAMNLGVDPRHADQMVRGVVNLPNGSGRTQRVAVFARGAKAEEAKAAGADIVGAEDLVERVNGGQIDFDRCIATPDLMPLVGRLGKVLGPRGLMPNPKVGTVTSAVTVPTLGLGIRPRGRGQGLVLGGEARRERAGVRGRRAEGQAGRRQGLVREQDFDFLDHGAGGEDRAYKRVPRRRRESMSFLWLGVPSCVRN